MRNVRSTKSVVSVLELTHVEAIRVYEYEVGAATAAAEAQVYPCRKSHNSSSSAATGRVAVEASVAHRSRRSQ